MLKALVKKDFARLFASLSTPKSKKGTKKNTGKGSAVGMIILWVFVFLSIAMAFLGISDALGSTLLPLQFDWLYYCILAMMAFLFAVVLNGFMSSSVLFNAKDNELLLAMPIPSGYILFSRMVELLILDLAYTIVVLVPAFIQRCIIKESFDVKDLVFCLIVIVLMTFTETAIASALGWLISTISKKVKNKSIVTVVLSVTFLSVYYYFQFNAQKYIALLVENSMTIGAKMESSIIALPFLKTGQALAGDAFALIACFSMTAVLFSIVYYVLTKTFIKVTTTSDKVIARKYDSRQQAEVKLLAPQKALFKKELARFVGSPAYMMNCGLGIAVMLLASVVMVIKKTAILAKIAEVIPFIEGTFAGEHLFSDIIPLVGLVVAFFAAGMMDITAPSISLEGKNIWILQTLPANPADIFIAKQNLEFYLSGVSSVIFIAAYAYVFSMQWNQIVIMVCCVLMFIKVHASLGLVLDLKMPKLDWTNEAVPVKQSLPVVISLFGSWIVAVIVGAVYYFILKDKLTAQSIMIALVVIFALCQRFLNKWLYSKGAKIFATL